MVLNLLFKSFWLPLSRRSFSVWAFCCLFISSIRSLSYSSKRTCDARSSLSFSKLRTSFSNFRSRTLRPSTLSCRDMASCSLASSLDKRSWFFFSIFTLNACASSTSFILSLSTFVRSSSSFRNLSFKSPCCFSKTFKLYFVSWSSVSIALFFLSIASLENDNSFFCCFEFPISLNTISFLIISSSTVRSLAVFFNVWFSVNRQSFSLLSSLTLSQSLPSLSFVSLGDLFNSKLVFLREFFSARSSYESLRNVSTS